MKGYNNDFGDGVNLRGDGIPQNGIDYNYAGSNFVEWVDSINITSDAHAVGEIGVPNSVMQNYKNGKLCYERYYDGSGFAYLDIDYSNHGNPKTHPKVPHEHHIWFDDDGGFHRGKDMGINK